MSFDLEYDRKRRKNLTTYDLIQALGRTGGPGKTSPFDLSGFYLPLTDNGNGQVNRILTRGAGEATFTRATTATTVNSSGLVIPVASGVARSYYDPTTLKYFGYLPEGARTNLCLRSEDFATTWTNVVSTESTNAGVAPDGNTTADRLIPDAAATTGAFLQTGLTLAAASTYTFSVWAKTGETFNSIQLQMGDNAFTNSVSVTYNTTTGAVESAAALAGTWTAASSTAKSYPNNWWRFSVTATATTNAGDRVTLVAPDTGDGTNGPLLWGAQVELGAFPSTYIPTTTLAVTRNADVLTYLSAGNAADATGAFYSEVAIYGTTGAIQGICDTNAGGYALYRAATGELSFFDNTAERKGSAFANSSTPIKVASNWGGVTGKTCQAGALSSALTFDGSMNFSANLGIGCNSVGTEQLFGTIKNVHIWTTLTDAQLQTITA